ncbi:aldo/keto reductase [Pseudomassariella vexata]|uniref:Aldo/keto reductase n=1 Tax=Pseudomassariella vexata TaxID=1141098 RepID=A0A1Y2E678_9PEZI|nr:aldo/keto reductase [Pseudomassariella vexata]ORY67009.1 aldo/keto reductase [Pseudomassariella vexata]
MAPNSIPYHPLGKNGPLVPAMGFGLMGMSYQTYGSTPNDEERFALLDRALEQGNTFWDSSDLYGDGEELLGKWFKRTGKRDQIFLSTKFGFVKGSKKMEVDSSGPYCKKACAESLRIMGIDCIDIYWLHSANPETPIEETMRALAELQAEGRIKHIGLSTISSTTLRRAVKIAPVAAIQIEYSVFTRDIEGPTGMNLLSTCRELGVAVVVAAPLGRGLLTTSFSAGKTPGDEKDIRTKAMPRFQEGNREQNVKVVNQFKAFADRKGCTVSQLALAWVMKQGEDIFPIPGTKKMKYLEENWGALGVNLSDEEEREIREFTETAEMAGNHTPQAFMDYIFRDTKEEGA